MKYCVKCGKEMADEANFCPSCGQKVGELRHEYSNTQTTAQKPNNDFTAEITTDFYGRNRLCAALFGILLGGFGVHEFYMGNTVAGVLSILFVWTGIPSIVGFVKGLIYLCQPSEEFKSKISDKIKAKYQTENTHDDWKF